MEKIDRTKGLAVVGKSRQGHKYVATLSQTPSHDWWRGFQRARLSFNTPKDGVEAYTMQRDRVYFDSMEELVPEIGAIVTGMERQGYDVQFREYPHGWRIDFAPRGTHDVRGTGWHPQPWVATQQAAWSALVQLAG